MKKNKYQTASAFRSAIETRLKKISQQEGIALARLRRHFAFDRLLFRIFNEFESAFVLKGGYSMELRFAETITRATKDIDLLVKKSEIDVSLEKQNLLIQSKLQKAADKDAADFFVFKIGDSILDLEALPYGGVRFPVEARMDDRQFERFPIDIVVTSLVLDPLEELQSHDWLSFLDIAPQKFPSISREQQFSEKLHAYTLPREKQKNSRVKDLIDLWLLIQENRINNEYLKKAIKMVFEYRGTHEVPKEILPAPEDWNEKYELLAKECGIENNLAGAYEALARFYSILIAE
jgi:predicted nucleotidyltransferase component of viral defense system